MLHVSQLEGAVEVLSITIIWAAIQNVGKSACYFLAGFYAPLSSMEINLKGQIDLFRLCSN